MNKMKESRSKKGLNVDPKVLVNVFIFGTLLGAFAVTIYYIFVK